MPTERRETSPPLARDGPCDRGAARRGFTLPEATLALVILGMAAAGVLLPFASGASVQAEGMRRTLAAKLANDLMEQIVATTPPANIVGSWNGFAEAEGQVTDANGAVFTDSMYAGFSREVLLCETRWLGSQAPLSANFVLITVQVAWQGRPIATLNSRIHI